MPNNSLHLYIFVRAIFLVSPPWHCLIELQFRLKVGSDQLETQILASFCPDVWVTRRGSKKITNILISIARWWQLNHCFSFFSFFWWVTICVYNCHFVYVCIYIYYIHTYCSLSLSIYIYIYIHIYIYIYTGYLVVIHIAAETILTLGDSNSYYPHPFSEITR